jgi:Mg-chelatase subunit ChlD
MIVTTPPALVLLLTLIPVIYLGLPRAAYRRGRDLASLLLRCLIILLLTLALAGTQIGRAADKLAVVFLIDASDSVGQAAREAQLAFIREALAAMPPDDQAALIAFGGDALVERPMSAVRELTALRSTPYSGATDIEEAIGLALALFPSDAGKRIVLMSDGVQTVGDALAAARRAAATGVRIDVVPFARDPLPEVQLTEVRAPSVVNAGQDFDLSLSVSTDQPTEAAITVFASGEIVHREEVTLRAGINHYALGLTAGDAGFRDFQVRITPSGADGFEQNNRLAAFTRVEGSPTILLVSQRGADAETVHLRAALEQQGLTVVERSPNAIPAGLAELAGYQAVVLANVPATQFTPLRMRTLQAYVRDLGGGLVVVGGPDSYAPGGYFDTPLEETLPLDMQIRDQQRIPQLTIAYVIDRSGSMTATDRSGYERLELAKEAIIRSIEFLQPSDRAGIVSFDTQGYWIADVQPVLDRRGLQNLVGTLRAGGGTDIQAGYRLAGEAMARDLSPRKHIILLTDGGAPRGQLVDAATQLYEEFDVTTSVIAIGDQSPFLREMSEVGGGNYHFVDLVQTIPTIFTVETVLATRSYILEDSFVPRLAGISPIMAGIDAAPPLRGYVASSPKQTAQVILTGPAPFNDPILAQWQYGLGRAVAFTSDAAARWGADWVGWDGFAQFWSQAVRWSITEGTTDRLEARVIEEGERARLIVDARDDDGAFLNGLALNAILTDPDLNALTLALQQTAPGRYEALFTPDVEGAYLLRVAGLDLAGEPVIGQAAGWVRTYSPEYSLQSADGGALLTDIVTLTGGRLLRDEPGTVFTERLQAQTGQTPIAFPLLLAAALLLPLDIAVRRLLLTRTDIQKARSAIGAALVGQRESTGKSTQTMSLLRDVKQRVRQNLSTDEMPAPVKPMSMPSDGEPSQPAQTPASRADDKDNIAGRLLQRRKRDDD